jgi:hypothetical protein
MLCDPQTYKLLWHLLLCHLPAVRNHDALAGGTIARSDRLGLLDHIVAADDLAKDDVLAVQPICLCGADKKLRAVRVGACVGHRQRARSKVASGTAGEGLVGELDAVDGLTASAVTAGKIATLAHELRNDAVESAVLVVQRSTELALALLTSAQRAEVLGSLWDDVLEELHLDAPCRLGANADFEEDQGVRRVDRVERDLLEA